MSFTALSAASIALIAERAASTAEMEIAELVAAADPPATAEPTLPDEKMLTASKPILSDAVIALAPPAE